MITPLLVSIILLALVFDYINGFHDAANAIATIVSTKVLTPFQAVLWAAFFNFLVFFIVTDHKVANTVAKTVNEQFITLQVIVCGLIAAIVWNLTTWWRGLPSSSSHTLIGGFAGAGMTHAVLVGSPALSAVNTHAITIILVCIVAAPFIGLVMSYGLTRLALRLAEHARPAHVNHVSRVLQLASSAALSFAHGGNDAQKIMAIIYVSLVAGAVIPANAPMPAWIPLACYTAIALGTLSGGWRIIKTMGLKITRITPLKGVSAETAGAITLFVTQFFGIPVSTTHTLTGTIIGAGLTRDSGAVRWPVVRRMAWAWAVTIPVSAGLAAVCYTAYWYGLRPH